MTEFDLIRGDVLKPQVWKQFADQSFDCCVTSPPYWGLRNYGVPGQLGLGKDLMGQDWRPPQSGQAHVKRDAFKTGGSGNSGGGAVAVKKLKPKDLIGIPWMLAFALRADGWYLRQDIVWSKTRPKPENVGDRPSRSHEYLFLLSKSRRYYYDREHAIERGTGDHGVEWRNWRSVWEMPTSNYSAEHFATFPIHLPRRCVIAGSRPGGRVLDPFNGAATTGLACVELQRDYTGIDISSEYIKQSLERAAPYLDRAKQQPRLDILDPSSCLVDDDFEDELEGSDWQNLLPL